VSPLHALQRQLSLTWQRFGTVLAVVLALGIFFRFAYLDQQVYWHDETYTSLRISGYSATEVIRQLFDGKLVGLDAFRQYQDPNPEKTVLDTVRSLALDDSQHPPVYYVLIRQWAIWFGTSITALRSLSALISLFAFPAMYWLTQELFAESSYASSQRAATQQRTANWTSGLAIALMALSPFHILYAQEVREYALWGVFILFASAAWLRAIRLGTLTSWMLFTVLFVLTLYTQPISLLLALGYGLYLLICSRFRLTRRVWMGVGALGLSIVAFFPWLQILAQSWSKTGATWTAVPLPLDILLKTWGLHLARAFWIPEGDFGFDHWFMYLSLPLLLLLSGLSFYTLYRQTPLSTWLFVMILTGSTFVPLGLVDLVLGGQRSASSRYVVPLYLGLPIVIAYFFAYQLSKPSATGRRVWQGAMAILLSVSLIFCVFNTQHNTVWTKGINYNVPAVANLINAVPKPLFVSNSFGINFGTTFALSYRLKPEAKFQLVDGTFSPDFLNMPQLAPGFTDIFLLNPTEPFRYQVEQQQQLKATLVFQDVHLYLWRFSKPHQQSLN
jgi:uncharacterized membrane protein